MRLSEKALSVILVLVTAFSVALSAQDSGTNENASAEREAFLIQPAKVPSGAQNFQIRLVASSPDLFASSSRKQPSLSFGSGVTLVDNSLTVINPGEIEARINVEDTTFGGVTAALTFYSQDGTSALRQERATLGVVGPLKVGPNEIDVSVDSLRLVRVNVDEAQTIANITLQGAVNGLITIAPPTGTLFAEGVAPTATAEPSTVRVTGMSVSTDQDSVSFTVENAAARDATITISNLQLNTADFETLGGVEGTLSSSITGTSLGEEAFLAVLAYTAQERLEGDEIPENTNDPDNTDSTTAPTDGSNDTSTNNSGFSNSSSGSGRSNSSSSRNRDNNRDAGGNSSRRTTPTRNTSASGGSSSGSVSKVNSRPQRRPTGSRSPGGASPRPAGNTSGSTSTGVGSARSGSGEDESADDARFESREKKDSPTESQSQGSQNTDPNGRPDYRLSEERKIRTSNTIYFADREYQPLASVVLEDPAGLQQRGRVWVVLIRENDISDEVDTVTVTLKIGLTRREVTLTESGPLTGVFRSDEDGILVSATTKN